MTSINDISTTELLKEVQALRCEMGKFQTLFPIFITSLEDNGVLYLNASASRFFGISWPEAKGVNASGLWSDPAEYLTFKDRVQKNTQVTDHESCLLTSAGEKRHVLLSATRTSYRDEEAVYTAFIDITSQKKAELALKKSQKRHHDLYRLVKLMSDTVPDLIWAKDLDDCYLFANTAICKKLLMCDDDESPFGKNDLYFAKRERERGYEHTFGEVCINSDEVVKKSGKPGKFLEEGLVRGKYLALEVQKAPMFDEEGKIVGTVGAGRDVTQDINTRNELQKSESMYRLLANNVRDAIWTTDDRLNITFVTPSIQVLTGFTPVEFLGLLKEERFPPDFRHRFRVVSRFLLKEARKGSPNTRLWEFQWYHKDGHVVWLETSTSAIYGASGNFEGFVCVTRDTTTKVKAHNLLERAKEEALQASRAKSEFLANMSHEIRTPMNGVLGMLQLLRQTSLNREQEEYVETAISSGTSLLKIISDILDFSKIEAGKIDLEEEKFMLVPVINSIIACFENLVNHEKVRLKTVIDQDLPAYIIGDETRLRQILFNLIGNSVKFTDQGYVAIRLRAEKCEHQMVKLFFEVEDTGIGIPAGKKTSLFNPFVQADGSFRRKYSGTGLGLSIVKQLVELMGGDIRIDSTLGKGTAISFFILAKPAQEGDEEKKDETPGYRKNTGFRRILVVEDESINAFVVTSMLEKLGYNPTLVNNGRKAIDILKEEQFDCILMDIQMPQMDGLETSRVIRENEVENFSTIPIIALTAHAMKGDRERFLAAGMNDYLTKPIGIEDLTNALDKFVNHTGVGEL